MVGNLDQYSLPFPLSQNIILCGQNISSLKIKKLQLWVIPKEFYIIGKFPRHFRDQQPKNSLSTHRGFQKKPLLFSELLIAPLCLWYCCRVAVIHLFAN